MDVIAGRDSIDATEARVLEPPRQHKVPIQPSPSRRYLCEGHSYLEGNSRLLGNDGHRAKGSNFCCEALVERANFCRLALEMVFEVMPPAGVRLVAIGEHAAASWAAPKISGFCHRLT